MILESICLSLLWVYAVSRVDLYIVAESSGSNADHILGSPLNYAAIILRSCLIEGRTWIRQTFGGNLGWIAVNVFMPCILIYLLLFIYTGLSVRGDMTGRDRLIIVLTDLIIFFIVLTTEYVQWTSYKGEIIEGVQGRYFLPLIPVSFLCLSNDRLKLPAKHINKAIYAYMAFYNIVALYTVYRYFS